MTRLYPLKERRHSESGLSRIGFKTGTVESRDSIAVQFPFLNGEGSSLYSEKALLTPCCSRASFRSCCDQDSGISDIRKTRNLVALDIVRSRRATRFVAPDFHAECNPSLPSTRLETLRLDQRKSAWMPLAS
jgi:hypothetical protein